MDNVELMDVLYAAYNLLEDGASLVFCNSELSLRYLSKT